MTKITKMASKMINTIQIADSFVHPSRKLPKSNGKPGHGESRLYVGNDESVSQRLATKPMQFDFSEYPNKPNKQITVPVHQQNGKEDTRRFYVGVKNLQPQQKKDWDEIRMCLIPQQTVFVIEEEADCFLVRVKQASSVEHKKGAGQSKIALRWLEYEASKANIKILHAGNGREFHMRTFKGYNCPVDGYCEETKTVYEFQGDYFHGNPAKFKETDLFHGKPYSEKWEKDKKKRELYESAGFKYVVMWESDWIEIEKKLKTSNV